MALNFHLYRTRLDSQEDKWIGIAVGDIVGPLIKRVRTAPPQTQLVLAAVAASFVAAILVIVIYVMLG